MTEFEEALDKIICNGVAPVTNEEFYLKSNLLLHFKDYQQQALPVVPNFIGEWLASNNLAGLLDEWYCHHEDMSSHIREYFERLPYKGPNNLSEMENNIVTFITRAKLDGYQVEKPQLFLLKHIDMSNSNEAYDRYLFKDVFGRFQHDTYEKGKIPTDHTCKFTKKEMDTMNIGSYEQIKVVE